jgi:hypothetical protein
VIGQLAAKYPGTVWDTIPAGLFNYGGGGIYSGGAVCGGYNGAMAVLRQMGAPAAVAQNYHRWFENTYLPTNAAYVDMASGSWTPAAGWSAYPATTAVTRLLNNAPKVKPMTTTCHGSHTRWKTAANTWLQAKGVTANNDRCGKLTYDCAFKLATLINQWKAGATIDGTLDPTTGATAAGCKQSNCHASTAGGYPESGVGGFMKCTPCHTQRIGDGHNL